MEHGVKKRIWCSPNDLDAEQIRNISSIDLKAKNNKEALTRNNEELKMRYHIAMVQLVRSEVSRIAEFITIPYTIFVTDDKGRILEILCSCPSLKKELNKAGIGIGSNFSKEYSGLNAVSLAMEMECIGVVSGEEHTIEVFNGLNCVCAPIIVDRVIQGYLDISFYKSRRLEFAIPFIQQITDNISRRWLDSSDLRKQDLEDKFQEYKLTAREREVAHLWLSEKGALHISGELGISEGTVRNIVKNIYTKLRVNERKQFVKKMAD